MYIVFDIGATKMRFAKVISEEKIGDPVIEPNPQNYDKAKKTIEDIINRLKGDEKIEGIVGGIPGVLNSSRKSLCNSPNLTDWNNKPFSYDLEMICGVEPVLYNDADLTTLGEATFGAGRGSEICAYMTISTGVGGGLVIDGDIVKTHMGSEPGFQIIDYKDNTRLHDLISGREISKEYGKLAKEIDDPLLWDNIETIVAVGIHNMIIFWSPDTIVFGGGIMRDLDIKDISNALKRRMTIFPELPNFRRAELGDYNGLYGGLAYVKKHFLN